MLLREPELLSVKGTRRKPRHPLSSRALRYFFFFFRQLTLEPDCSTDGTVNELNKKEKTKADDADDINRMGLNRSDVREGRSRATDQRRDVVRLCKFFLDTVSLREPAGGTMDAIGIRAIINRSNYRASHRTKVVPPATL